MIKNECSVSDCNKITDGIIWEILKNNKEISFCSSHSFMYHQSKYLYSKNDKELIKFNYYLFKTTLLCNRINFNFLVAILNSGKKNLFLINSYNELLNEYNIELMIKFIKFRRKNEEEYFNNIRSFKQK